MNTRKNCLVVVIALPVVSLWLPAHAQKPTLQDLWKRNNAPADSNKPVSQRDFATKASADAAALERQKLGYKTTVTYDAKRKVYVLSEYPSTSPVPDNNPVLSQRDFSTKASAEIAAAARRKLGYYTTVTYDAKRKVYVLREYAKAPTPDEPVSNPVLSERRFSTKASADAAAAARQKLGYKTTVTYDAKDRVYILREYNATPSTEPTEPALSQRDFSTKASAETAAVARQKLGYKTTVTYDAKRDVYVLSEYATASTPALSRRDYTTKASAEAAAEARQKLGFKTTVIYDAKRNVYVLSEYDGK